MGIDPKLPVVADVPLCQGTADDLSVFPNDFFDLVIYGFCLYLADPEDYFLIAAESDRVLQDEGHIVVHDFFSVTPFRRPYDHRPGVFSHHFMPDAIWLGHPSYHLVERRITSGEEAVSILRKDTSWRDG